MKRAHVVLLGFFSLVLACSAQSVKSPQQFRVLVFSKTLLYRHASITNGVAALKKLGDENQFNVDTTEDSAAMTSSNLEKYKVVLFLSTSGDVLNETQQDAVKHFIENGGGFVGVHAAVAGDVATEGSWPWYGELLCASFTNHSRIVTATIDIEDHNHPATAHLPRQWNRIDEWYNFIETPRDAVRVLANLDESTYEGGAMGKDHPVIWCKQVGKGRLFYTALGHTAESYTEPNFLKHLLGGIQFAASHN